jgi:hypothetical protein
LTGANYHGATTTFVMKLLRAGTQDAAAVNLTRALMRHSSGPRDDRWNARYSDIQRAASTGRSKISFHQSERQGADEEKSPNQHDQSLRFTAQTNTMHT